MTNKDLEFHQVFEKYDGFKNDNHEKMLKLPKTSEHVPTGMCEIEMPNPADDSIIVIHLPTTGGHFLCKLLSCNPSLSGDNFVNEIYNIYGTDRAYWGSYSYIHHPTICSLHTRDVDFETILNYKKVILVEYTGSDEERILVQNRLKHLQGNSMTNRAFAALQIKHNKILREFLAENHKTYHSFPFSAYLDSKNFANEINNIFDYLGFSHMEEKTLIDLHKFWRKTNAKHHKFVQKIINDIV